MIIPGGELSLDGEPLRPLPQRGPKSVLAYVLRYTHRVAISNTRLSAHDSRRVTFRYRDYRADGLPRHKVMVIRSAEGAQLRSRIAPTFAMDQVRDSVGLSQRPFQDLEVTLPSIRSRESPTRRVSTLNSLACFNQASSKGSVRILGVSGPSPAPESEPSSASSARAKSP